MAMVIRTVFNNRNWEGKCTNVEGDKRLFKCQKQDVDTGFEIDKNGNCSSEDCLEQTLCRKHFWKRKKRNINPDRARGNVFFVFTDIDKSLVLWGRSKVKKVVGKRVDFEEVERMPRKKWIPGLSSKDISGKNWGHGTYRFIDAKKESKLEKLIAIKK